MEYNNPAGWCLSTAFADIVTGWHTLYDRDQWDSRIECAADSCTFDCDYCAADCRFCAEWFGRYGTIYGEFR
jgi:hypothetical protein